MAILYILETSVGHDAGNMKPFTPSIDAVVSVTTETSRRRLVGKTVLDETCQKSISLLWTTWSIKVRLLSDVL